MIAFVRYYQDLGGSLVVLSESLVPLECVRIRFCALFSLWFSSWPCVFNFDCAGGLLMLIMIGSFLVFVLKPQCYFTLLVRKECFELQCFVQHWHQRGWARQSKSLDYHPLSPSLLIMMNFKLAPSPSIYITMTLVCLFNLTVSVAFGIVQFVLLVVIAFSVCMWL